MSTQAESNIPVRSRPHNKLRAIKQRWRDQVIFDGALSGLTKTVAYAMANWITAAETRTHFERDGIVIVQGTQRILALSVGCSAKTVHLAMTSLIEHGHLVLVRRPQGRDDTNRYRIITKAGRNRRNSGWAPCGTLEHADQPL